jgi:hypothetical protein
LASQEALWRPLYQSDRVEDKATAACRQPRPAPRTVSCLMGQNAPGLPAAPEADFNQISSHHRKGGFPD